MCNWLIQETHPKIVLVFERRSYHKIQFYLIHGSINDNDAFSVYRCVNMHVYMHMYAIRDIYVGIHVYERKCFILEELQHSALFLFCVLHSQNNLLWMTDIGAYKHYGFKSALTDFISSMYISSTTALLFFTRVLCTWNVCHLAIKIMSFSLSIFRCFLSCYIMRYQWAVTTSYVILCSVMLCCVMLYVTLRTLRYLTLRYATLRCVTLLNIILCYVIGRLLTSSGGANESDKCQKLRKTGKDNE